MREVMLVFHFIGLTMGLGTGFAHAFLGSAVAKMPENERIKFQVHSLVLRNMGNIGLVLLIISGFYLITPYWKTLASSPLLILKLVLVAILSVIIILINISSKRAINGDAERQIKKMKAMGKITLIIALAIVIVAVSFFH